MSLYNLSETTLYEVIQLLEKGIKEKKSWNRISEEADLNRNYLTNHIAVLNKMDESLFINESKLGNLLLTVRSLVEEYKKMRSETIKTTKKKPLNDSEITLDDVEDNDYDERSYSEIIREGDPITLDDGKTTVNRITEYYYNIKVQGKPDLTGYLTREEMELIYRLYSNMDGAGLTQRTVSRHFKNISFPDFKRILRAFNVTKSSHPVAPHIIEESSLNEVVDIIYRNKENNLFKKVEEERSKSTEKLLKDVQKELIETKAKLSDVTSLISNIIIEDIQPFVITKSPVKNEKAIFVYLSDMHVGAHTDEDSIYKNHYNEAEFNNRLRKTCDEIIKQHHTFGRFDKIVVCNLGDSLDGYNGETTRGGHHLPQNMNNKEQFNVYVKGMISFFETLHTLDLTNNIDYMCVGDANHDGDFGYIANKSLEMYLNVKYPSLTTRIFEKYIEHFNYGVHTFMLSHGKDKLDKISGFKLNLNDSIELYLDEYIYNHGITTRYNHVISGDLHQTSVNYAKRFRYKKVSSLYGSSKWIHTNFGNTKPAVDYEIVSKTDGTILEGRLVLN